VAASRVTGADFRLGDLGQLPIDDADVDVAVCGLALSHVADLGPVMAELARVVRPGGHLVISDTHHELVFLGSVVKAMGPAGEPGLVPTFRHTPGAFLRAALPAGFEVLRCEEPRIRRSGVSADAPAEAAPWGSWEQWPWSLLGVLPAAAAAAWDIPATIVWHFRRRL
jgi:SAM-dependent methyltransferase